MIQSELRLDNACLGKMFQLVEVMPNYYENGRRVDVPHGYRYSVCVRAHRNDKLSVLIPGAQLMETPSTMQDIYVEFAELVVRPYVDRTGRLALTATASGIKQIKPGNGHDGTAENTGSKSGH